LPSRSTHDFAGKTRQINRTFVDFNARHNALLRQELGKGRATAGRGANGFFEQNHAADCFLQPLGREKHFPVSAAIIFAGFDLDAIKAPFDSAHALIGRKDSLSFGNHRPRNGFKFLFGHGYFPPFA
jgi:hypothetical protein